MGQSLIKQAKVVNEGVEFIADVRLKHGRIDKIASEISALPGDDIINAEGHLLLPGMIDDQVHFREPGLTHKGSILSESSAAVAGGITSYMEMPNVTPATTTIEALENKFALAAKKSVANYSFYLGATEDNLGEIKRIDPRRHCGLKVFMGASTGDLLVEHPQALDAIFRESPGLIVTHCESGSIIKDNLRTIGRSNLDIHDHPAIRCSEACYASSSYAVSLAKQYESDLHVLHLTTEKELSLFSKGPIINKRITAEACVHHLWFDCNDYQRLGNLIKCNPAIKTTRDRDALIAAVNDDRIDIIATDHAPHSWQEKRQKYDRAPAGLPLVQHALLCLLDLVSAKRFTLSTVVEKTAHNPSIRYGIVDRGFVREGYFADLVLVDPNRETPVFHSNTLYKCGWTPFDEHVFTHHIASTWVNGKLVFDGKRVVVNPRSAQRLTFNR